ncbi:MAG: glucosaminidase domain-containing protein [Verrucomicrobiales bacterium]|nr:glucosaminidase domain-containing protein [Verrucomicrobiales bacterium]
MKEIKDQLQTVHALEYDKLSRLIHDRVTAFGSGVDQTVKRISRTYEARGLLEKVSSVNNADPLSGTVLNEVRFDYNDFSQLIREFQEHSDVVNTANPGSLRLLYDYANASGSTNHVRPTSLRYPTPTSNSPTTRLLSYDYASGTDANLNRVSKLLDGAADRVVYSYLGLQEIIRVQYSEPGMELTYLKQGSESDGPAGDQYNGLDRFGRCVDQRCLKTSDPVTHFERVKYGFDRASNRLWRENSGTTGQDFIHAYDGLNRLTRFRRGDLNGTYDNVTNLSYEQQWSFDPTDNWTLEKKDVNGDGTWDWDKTRSHNKANEILTIGGVSSNLAHSLAGNMTKVPQMWTESATWDLTWDAWNRLVKVMDGANTVNQHKYDGLNRRIVRTVGSVNRHYYYSNQWQILEERKDSNTYPERQFFWGMRFVDDLVWRDRDADGDGSHTLEERLYVLNDYFHVTAVANPSGVVQERCWYDAYGYAFVLTGSFAPRGGISSSLYDWETWYGSYRQDLETALHQVRNRFFHFKLGRWLNRDPIDYDGSINLYAYVGNNSINLIDAFGEAVLPPDFIGPPNRDDFFGTPIPDPRPPNNSRADRERYAREIMNQFADFQRRNPDKCCQLDPCTLTTQWILESNWGRSEASRRGHNLGGVKGEGPAGSIELPTTEVVKGRRVRINAKFRNYHDFQEYYASYANLICTDDRYKNARGKKGEEYYKALQRGGYSTDPNYGSLLMPIYRQLGCK